MCWGGEDEEESKDGECEMCVKEGESGEESRAAVMYVWVVLHVYVWGWRGRWGWG